MALQILSDVHLEAPKAYDIFEITPKAPYLALIRDIGNVVSHKGDFTASLKRKSRQFRAVLFVPGNHEAYHSDWATTIDLLRAFDLFSSIPPEKEQAVSFGLNDFFQIDSWDVQAHNEAHLRAIAWLNAEVAHLEQLDTTTIVLSHWSPSTDVRSVDPRHSASPISSGFSTDLSSQPCFQNKNFKVWAFGHTHYNCDFMADRRRDAGPLRLLTNRRDYFAQADGLDREEIVALGSLSG
ncbi:hypothetical protein HBI25_149300 [Parastagonospora nodorum]|nr:hypothetical protein HBH53_147330 [Parastagonospora nodorum]KAH3966888.1 hypothetical protein HBH51_138730 [Parastagonospora nodorum]KAH4088507.1 hypothetical protein HBH46_196580 [Parastagonospora nodorum]KAH4162811.1 hypothetical protein HBH43_164730 [Parastagonospora nodorum]KAH4981399.1 hypothetical protein HBI76_169300 [Parastagonospora nodorum]